jgi:apolipoprotein N-acyltransferase
MEYARGHLLTGFPWNVLGYALTYPLSLLQSAALIGIYGLTLVGVALLAAPLVLLAEAATSPAGRRRRGLALALGIMPLLALAAWGHLRLAGAPAAMVPGVKLRIVQPSVPQREKWRPENQERIFLDHLHLSASNAAGLPDGLEGITHVIWPEAAMPFLPVDHPVARAAIGRLLPPGTLLIAGGLRAEAAPAGSMAARRIFNSLLVFGDGLRQGPPRALWRVPAVSGGARGRRPAKPDAAARRLCQWGGAPSALAPARAARAGAPHLL